ncbi:MAG: type II toxin-antitoxin system VapC family toxin [Gammaproteobacteria bacterium]|nr:type II toxin-antitoxin system VapC family toxin [Gammaproteobacteria bacterium]
MRVVIDTNVLAYALLGTPGHAPEALRLLRVARALLAPALWEAEIGNVVWMAARAGVISRDEAPARLRTAARFGVESVSCRSLWQGALTRALAADVAVYDSLFVELACREGVPLATHDLRLLQTWPAHCRRPADLLPA